MARGTPEIVFTGHLVREMIHFPERSLGPVLGSPVAYGSLMASRLGGQAGIVSLVGTDMPPALLQPLREAGVDLAGLQVVEGEHTTRSELIYSEDGHKQIRYPQQAPPIRPEHIPQRFRDAPVFAVVTMDQDVPAETIRQMRSLPGLLAVDLGAMAGLIRGSIPTRRRSARRAPCWNWSPVLTSCAPVWKIARCYWARWRSPMMRPCARRWRPCWRRGRPSP